MIQTSAIGSLVISALVTRWNNSKDTQQKETIRKYLLSGDTLQIHKVVSKILKIADDQFETIPFYWSGNQRIKMDLVQSLMGTILIKDYTGGISASQVEVFVSKARGEFIHFFIMMFKAGHFEQLPMPEFGYELPDQGEEGTAEGAIAAAKATAVHLPGDLKMGFPPEQLENQAEIVLERRVLDDQGRMSVKGPRKDQAEKHDENIAFGGFPDSTRMD